MGINLLMCFVLFWAMTGHSNATYCVCNNGVSDSLLQKNIDYACGSGADCSAILQTGACYIPNTIKDHCNYAVNSYYQRKGQVNGSCDFSGTATSATTVPNQSTGCVYQSSPTSTTPSITPSPSTTTNNTTTTTTTTPSIFGVPPPPGIDNANSLLRGSNMLGLFTWTLLLSYLLCSLRA